jgi:hypothetical protein
LLQRVDPHASVALEAAFTAQVVERAQGRHHGRARRWPRGDNLVPSR